MKIALAGGLGFEEDLLKGLAGHQLLLVGNSYNIKNEKFSLYKEAECIGEFVTRNYQSFFSEYDLYIDISESLKSKYLLNDFSIKFRKKYIALFFDQTWKAGVFFPEKGCLACYKDYQRPLPFFLNPGIDKEAAINAILSNCKPDQTESFVYSLDKGQKVSIPLLDNCLTSKGNLRFLPGEMEDVVSVSCGDNSVAVTPMNEVAIDLNYYKEILSKELKIIKQSPFYLEFKILHLSALLFKQGRLIVKGTKSKNTALAVYRKFIGN